MIVPVLQSDFVPDFNSHISELLDLLLRAHMLG